MIFLMRNEHFLRMVLHKIAVSKEISFDELWFCMILLVL
jgi:hypothetical protein